LAIIGRRVAEVKVRLDKNPTLIHQDLLHTAVTWGNPELVQLLLERGANIEARRFGESPLQLAVKGGHTHVAELVLQKGARLDIHSAAGLGKIHHVKWVLRGNPKLAQSTRSGCKETPLHWAVRGEQVEVVRYLLSHGGNSSANGSLDYTPLHYAVLSNEESIIQLLLAHGAKLERKSSNGCTPLYLAVKLKQLTVARTLLKAGANVNTCRDVRGTGCSYEEPSMTIPLHLAAVEGHIEMIELLLAHKADVKARDRNGHTPLELWRQSLDHPWNKAYQSFDLFQHRVLSAPEQARQRLTEILRRVALYPSRH
jgi:ankyrin repeat protein